MRSSSQKFLLVLAFRAPEITALGNANEYSVCIMIFTEALKKEVFGHPIRNAALTKAKIVERATVRPKELHGVTLKSDRAIVNRAQKLTS